MLVSYLKALFLLFAVAGFANALRSPRGLDFNLEVCSSRGNCWNEPTQLVMDFEYNCNDPTTCYEIPTQNIYEDKFGIFATRDAVTFYQNNRLYFYNASGEEYRMFNLLNRELTYDIDLSQVGCGFNAAIFLDTMPADGGKAEFGYTGATYGTGYCDGKDYPPNCWEMDVWEANSLSTMFTIHPCNGTNCNAYGCGLNPYKFGFKDFYGRGSDYQVDTTLPFTVVTQFFTTDGTDDGDLKEIRQFYVQNGNRIDTPTVQGGFNTITDAFCETHYVPSMKPGYEYFGLGPGMSPGMRKGMVLILALWGNSNDDFMQWLDTEPNGPCPAAFTAPNATATYSRFRFGAIGSTV